MFKKNTLSTIVFAGALLALTFTISLVSSPVQAGPSKVEVCHVPPDDPDNFHTITVSESALAAHISHFDLGGACDGNCSELCDDGNLCTYEDTGDCQSSGCPVPQPVVCGEGQVCDPEAGCVEVEQDCPCFTADDLAAQGAFSQCANPFPGFSTTAGVLFENGSLACSGPDCSGPDVSCGLAPAFTDDTLITTEQNAACQALIEEYCGL